MSKQRNTNPARFFTVTPTGTVNVDADGFLRSDDGRKQVQLIKELRAFTRGNSPKPETKKVG